MTGVTIKNNKAEDGGGIQNDSVLTIEDSTISNNSATDNGGGIFNLGIMTIRNVTIRNNTAVCGGGIKSIADGEVTIEDSTITRNVAKLGGGIENTNLMYVYGSKITCNIADKGGGFYNLENGASIVYIDDLTELINNMVNDFEGKPFVPA